MWGSLEVVLFECLLAIQEGMSWATKIESLSEAKNSFTDMKDFCKKFQV